MKNYNRNYYNAQGQRVAKLSNKTSNYYTQEYYIHDATGNRLATYSADDLNRSTLSWTEQTLYGSSRLGTISPNINATLANPADSFAVKSLTQYELTNHLGNVMTTITDRKTPTGNSFSPVVQTATYIIASHSIEQTSKGFYLVFALGCFQTRFLQKQARPCRRLSFGSAY